MKVMTPEQKMIQYLRNSMQEMKKKHREKEEELREQYHQDILKYQNIECALMMKIRVQGKFIERLKEQREELLNGKRQTEEG